MHEFFTRTLQRRGIYTGTYTSWGADVPRPAFYILVNHRGNGMVRFEAGAFGKSFWVDWGNTP